MLQYKHHCLGLGEAYKKSNLFKGTSCFSLLLLILKDIFYIKNVQYISHCFTIMSEETFLCRRVCGIHSETMWNKVKISKIDA